MPEKRDLDQPEQNEDMFKDDEEIVGAEDESDEEEFEDTEEEEEFDEKSPDQ